jgi:hypothetical protein
MTRKGRAPLYMSTQRQRQRVTKRGVHAVQLAGFLFKRTGSENGEVELPYIEADFVSFGEPAFGGSTLYENVKAQHTHKRSERDIYTGETSG